MMSVRASKTGSPWPCSIAVSCACFFRLRHNNQRWRAYPTFLIRENRWRAQRYGVSDTMIDFGRGEMMPYVDLIDELIDHVMEGRRGA